MTRSSLAITIIIALGIAAYVPAVLTSVAHIQTMEIEAP